MGVLSLNFWASAFGASGQPLESKWPQAATRIFANIAQGVAGSVRLSDSAGAELLIPRQQQHSHPLSCSQALAILHAGKYMASAELTGKRQASNHSVRATHRSYAFSHAAPDTSLRYLSYCSYDLICRAINSRLIRSCDRRVSCVEWMRCDTRRLKDAGLFAALQAVT